MLFPALFALSPLVLLIIIGAWLYFRWWPKQKEKFYCYHDQPCWCGKRKDPNYDYTWSLF